MFAVGPSGWHQRGRRSALGDALSAPRAARALHRDEQLRFLLSKHITRFRLLRLQPHPCAPKGPTVFELKSTEGALEAYRRLKRMHDEDLIKAICSVLTEERDARARDLRAEFRKAQAAWLARRLAYSSRLVFLSRSDPCAPE